VIDTQFCFFELLDMASPAHSLTTSVLSPELSVSDLPEHGHAIIERICDDRGAVGAKLRALGFVPNTPLEVMRRSPFRGPVVVSVRGIRVALRFSEAELVRIRPVDGERKIGVILQ